MGGTFSSAKIKGRISKEEYNEQLISLLPVCLIYHVRIEYLTFICSNSVDIRIFAGEGFVSGISNFELLESNYS